MTLDTAGKRNVLNPRNPDPRLILISLAHPDFAETSYFVQNFEDVVGPGGQVYTALPFELELPTDDDGVPRGSIRIANITRALWNLIDQITSPPVLTLTFVLASAPSVIQRTYTYLEVRRVIGTFLAIEAEFSHENYGAEPYPARRLTPSVFTWLNRQG